MTYLTIRLAVFVVMMGGMSAAAATPPKPASDLTIAAVVGLMLVAGAVMYGVWRSWQQIRP